MHVLDRLGPASDVVVADDENGYPIETLIAISTDKHCKPVNVMGMTKSIQERIITSANILNPQTRFICVRYGNVLASRGSVIPLFIDQIKKGGPVTVTVPEMTRFLLSLDQAVDTVFAALRDARPGETYIPQAPSATVINIAKALIEDRAIDIQITGIRPGEKMHEILVSEEEANHCVDRGDYYAILSMLPELIKNNGNESNALSKEYSSADAVLDLEGTIELLKRHQLTVEDVELNHRGELLR
jgi:UDP-glucose 4-epimerase